jgi:alpha-ribazole phosphatase
MRLVLVRHTATSGVDGICYGRTDVALASGFNTEAAAVKAAVREATGGCPFTLHTSPARRCRLLAESFGVPFIEDPRLQELDFGAWEGKAWDEIPRDALDLWSQDFVKARPPDGENFLELAARAERFVADLDGLEEPAVAVTHAGVIRALLAPRRGLNYRDAFSIDAPLGGVIVLEAGAVGLMGIAGRPGGG